MNIYTRVRIKDKYQNVRFENILSRRFANYSADKFQ